MNPTIQNKCDLLVDNYYNCWTAAKLDFRQSAALGGLIYTQKNQAANEQTIRSCRRILKKKVGMFNNLRGNTNLALLCKMGMAFNPEAYLDEVLYAYSFIQKKHTYRTEYQALAASCIADFAKPEQFESIVDEAEDILQLMSKKHPLLTSSEDLTLAALLAMADLDVETTLDEADACYNNLKETGSFKLVKNSLQSISMVLALHEGSAEEKCARFMQMRDGLKTANSRMGSSQLPVIAALACMDVPIEQLIEEIHDADVYLKGKWGFSNVIGLGAQMRRVMASAIVLQVHGEELGRKNAASSNSAVTAVLVEQIIQQIIMMIIITAVVVSTVTSSSSAS